ncbi:MAG: hypothetical protein A2268_14805 [Candidatus Raymondbacteria bacterium RifOxyA12_full_50_37]|uniref:Thioredoxin-like fold domain-containing protein n=1 Tax=Candidatus Raymondbacteria bacterium RIFOXYD12_FULL_49_13 TaxID=1817890 RepID=A0A1F7F2G6_UNCRA|nr:MAG: hypothetical protein A2268_14805 [Candidatus Raymondbacteria bacterium RifOxyA12_full_50_37]OGJ87834.1 MAG: hypothetical protein A2350_12750 [Candidatus Raymondbacteria bacterium RifOxyB12_full_50_8]OGJ88688.1 MAG: hypothetical protein A2248_20740 [Candidatus Raymondbacteria bacterium RIFOXYA2_FULL_49_16]OGK00860.1 MAG: hypothetical protein A2519_07995 [Candidatus Raymondbacteria bacterium RIFOXYD12_FULL_49_13]OGP41725.1 MAG: hypothetical protein A2324_07830 [Candidatus Raymondbacteria 
MKVVFVCGILLFAGILTAGQQECSSISGNREKDLVAKIISSYHLYDCSDGTISEGLASSQCNRLANRLKNNVCRLAQKGLPEKSIRDALDRRGQTMVSFEPPASIECEGVLSLGSDSAKVVLVVYLCARCRFCRVIIPQLYHAITVGELNGKVRIVARLFPIKGHEGSVEGGVAFQAAAHLEKFWEYALLAYRNFDSFSTGHIRNWADSAGFTRTAFDSLYDNAAIREEVVHSKKEGMRLGVSETPAFFINGRRYVADMDIQTLVDILEEEYENRE